MADPNAGAVVQVDVSFGGPREVSVSVGGATSTLQRRETTLVTTSSDLNSGFCNVAQMKVWGDIDLGMDGRIKATEGASEWMPFSRSLQIVTSAGAGIKTFNVRLKNSQGDVSLVASDSATLGSTVHASVLWTSPRKHIGAGTTSTQVWWSSSHDFTSYSVVAVDNIYATSGVALLSGSNVNVSGGAGTAGTLMKTKIATASDFDRASISPLLSGRKIIKVFITYVSPTGVGSGTFS